MPRDHGHEQNSPDELQPGRGRHSQRPDSARNRRAGRTDGPRHRRHGNTVPHAQPLEGPGRVEPPRAVRPRQVHMAMAHRARPHRRPRHMAGPGRRAPGGARRGRGRAHRVGRGAARQERGAHRRHLPQRPAAHRAKATARRTHSRTGRDAPNREHHPARHNRRTHEDRHARAHRPPKRTLRGHGGAGGRTGLPRLQLHVARQAAEATYVLDMLHQPRRARHAKGRTGRLAAVQRTDTKHRAALLPVNRDQARHLPRQAATPPVPRTRRRRHQRDVPQRLLLVHADGRANKRAKAHTGPARRQGVPPGIRHRVRLLRPDAAAPHARIEARARPLHGRTGERHHRLRGGRGSWPE